MAVTWGGGNVGIGVGVPSPPGGSSGQVQFNSAGAFAGDAGLTYDAATDTLTVAGAAVVGSSIGLALYNEQVWFGTDGSLKWASTAGWAGNKDSGLRRVSPGLVGVTSGGSNLGSVQAGNYTAVALGTPGAVTVTPTGTTGATTYTYVVVAKLNDGTTSPAGPASSTATGNATLTGTDYNLLAWGAVTGAASYDVYRTVGGATQGKIIVGYSAAFPEIADTGYPGGGETPPTTNTTGRVLVGDGSATAPAYGFNGATGIWRETVAGYSGISFVTDGATRFNFIDTTFAAYFQINGAGVRLPIGSYVGWSASADTNTVPDTGLVRGAAGVVKVTNGSAGSGNLNIGVPPFANNAAALAGGLVAGDLYYTDTAGEYIVKVAH